ncbi:hypothetical protein Ava_A0009 (plasmid) [Trichormus variabilis ATCC 29413]|uniref:ARC6 IMS domain-containing protein n=4 Tax=Anabaena variabilis TaxID=264691 RepID=Q3M1R9_TRIV2|nr:MULTISPECIES: hypothetical protein [Nostocaceae]ABA25067.1 hypothetical protein Ava_A0009 [Trichormus variabilis ATCC 29413]MBC1218135.1 hypothetical protein [Trichormus variabilis ARAD]MBC1270902.1 hypothetical protein [Trichormus variabilis FSR]MBC1305822.1 hypothetical protein [Trichormus variabilis N2B]MBC1330051.1 hypothetical protein [Trichormus variabilis 9RC]
MNILLKLASPLFVIPLIVSGCTSSSGNTQNVISPNPSKCPDKSDAVLDAKKVKTINLSTQKITESGIVNQDKSVGYVFEAQAGQKLVYNTIQKVCISVYTPDNQLLNSGVLPITGKYTVQIAIPQGSTTFDLAMNLETQSTPSVPSPTVTPTTVNPPLVTTPPSVSPSPTPTNTFISRPLPTKLIEDYFAEINNDQYRNAWNILPVELQEDKKLHPNGYDSFLEWYKGKVDFINIHNISLVESNQNSATVKMKSTYDMKSGKKAPVNLKFYMIWNKSKQKWDISETKVID